MMICPNCRTELPEDSRFCPVCGTAVHTVPPRQEIPYQAPVYTPPVPKVDPYDHTAKFDPEDARQNKLICMLVYLLDAVGVIIALLAAKDSMYTAFHIKQSLKFTVLEVLLALACGVLCWTFIVPILGGIAMAVLMVIKFISFVQVCSNQAKEPALVRSLSFLN